MAAAVMSIVPPIRPTPDPWTAPDRLQLVTTSPQTTANALPPPLADDQQALRAEAFRWLRDLATRATP